MMIPRSIDHYVELLEEETPFTLSNIGGDGEFLTIVGWGQRNSDDRLSTPEKQRELGLTLLQPRLTYHGYNPGHLDSDKRRNAETWLRAHNINVPYYERGLQDPHLGNCDINVRWVHKEIISSANVRGDLGPFIKALRRRDLVVVGSDWLNGGLLDDTLEASAALLVPQDVGWEERNSIREDLAKILSTSPPDTVVTWGLGYVTKVLMWDLVREFPTVTQIDIGAVWDPYCGVYNRHGYKKPAWQEAMAKNLEESR